MMMRKMKVERAKVPKRWTKPVRILALQVGDLGILSKISFFFLSVIISTKNEWNLTPHIVSRSYLFKVCCLLLHVGCLGHACPVRVVYDCISVPNPFYMLSS